MEHKDWEYIGVPEAAKKAGIGVTKMRRLCADGTVEAVRTTDRKQSHWKMLEKSIYKAMAEGKIKNRNNGTKHPQPSKPRPSGHKEKTQDVVKAYCTAITARLMSNGMSPKEAVYETNVIAGMAAELMDEQG